MSIYEPVQHKSVRYAQQDNNPYYRVESILVDQLHHDGEYAPVTMTFTSDAQRIAYFQSHPDRYQSDINVKVKD